MTERNIVIGLITSTDYCLQIKNAWNLQYLESSTAKRIASWCWEYFDTYSQAPGRNIETLYHDKLKANKIPKELAEEIENEILPSLSEEYERTDFNVDYHVGETLKYFSEQNVRLFTANIQALLAEGKLDEAEKMAAEFKAINAHLPDLDDYILTIIQMRKRVRDKPLMLMRPWLRAGQTTIIYGAYGSGKSLLTIAVAYVLGLRRWDTRKSEIGEWQVKNPTGTLYVDGELGELEMEERISQFEWLGVQQSQYRIRVLSIPEYQLATEDQFYLSDRRNQLRIIEWLKTHPTYQLVVLDSVSTLFGLIEENDNSEWNTKINPFLRDLRALGVACILLHHAGKDNKRGLRGASSMGAMAHNIFRLQIHGEKNIDDGEAWFTLGKDKQRAAGFSFKTFSLHFTQSEDQKETHWDVTDNT